MATADVASSPDVVERRRMAMEVLFGESPISGGEEEDMGIQSDDDQVYKVVPADKSTWQHLRFENREAFVKFYKDFAHWRGFGVRRIGAQTRKPKFFISSILAFVIPFSTIDIIDAGLHFFPGGLDLPISFCDTASSIESEVCPLPT
ncbi:unnamed protein product [Linum trigynum]|uniref:Uncharacterized protein n=1 Tax=Linum trigynum TaxID=586398 RepID=A0AAV2DQH9_9ROSI